MPNAGCNEGTNTGRNDGANTGCNLCQNTERNDGANTGTATKRTAQTAAFINHMVAAD